MTQPQTTYTIEKEEYSKSGALLIVRDSSNRKHILFFYMVSRGKLEEYLSGMPLDFVPYTTDFLGVRLMAKFEPTAEGWAKGLEFMDFLGNNRISNH